MSLFARKEIKGITDRTLSMILESSKDAYPNEFAAGMREIDGIISELILVPRTITSHSKALLQLHHLPIDYSMVGIVHSHPSSNIHPSQNDMIMFGRYGRVHIIVGMPYDMNSWRAYDYNGKEIELPLL